MKLLQVALCNSFDHTTSRGTLTRFRWRVLCDWNRDQRLTSIQLRLAVVQLNDLFSKSSDGDLSMLLCSSAATSNDKADPDASVLGLKSTVWSTTSSS